MDLPLLIAVQTAAAETYSAFPARDWLSWAVDISIVVAAVVVTLLAIFTLGILAQFRRAMSEARMTLRQNLGPVSDRARSISDNVQFITQAVRTDVERLNASVKALAARLHQASDRMDERIEDFNALMEVVQSEAEDIFLDTASTVRGVRHGARSLSRRTHQSELAPADDLDEEDALDNEEDPATISPEDG